MRTTRLGSEDAEDAERAATTSWTTWLVGGKDHSSVIAATRMDARMAALQASPDVECTDDTDARPLTDDDRAFLRQSTNEAYMFKKDKKKLKKLREPGLEVLWGERSFV